MARVRLEVPWVDLIVALTDGETHHPTASDAAWRIHKWAADFDVAVDLEVRWAQDAETVTCRPVLDWEFVDLDVPRMVAVFEGTVEDLKVFATPRRRAPEEDRDELPDVREAFKEIGLAILGRARAVRAAIAGLQDAYMTAEIQETNVGPIRPTATTCPASGMAVPSDQAHKIATMIYRVTGLAPCSACHEPSVAVHLGAPGMPAGVWVYSEHTFKAAPDQETS